MARFPKAYLNDVPSTDNHPGIVRVPLASMDIGARRSTLAQVGKVNGLEGIDHVGKNGSGSK